MCIRVIQMKTDYCRKYGCEYEEPTAVIVEDDAVIWHYQCIHQPTKVHSSEYMTVHEPMGPRCENTEVIRFDLQYVEYDDARYSPEEIEEYPDIEAAYIELEIEAYNTDPLDHHSDEETEIEIIDVDPDEEMGHVELGMDTEYGYIEVRYEP